MAAMWPNKREADEREPDAEILKNPISKVAGLFDRVGCDKAHKQKFDRPDASTADDDWDGVMIEMGTKSR